MFGGVCVVCYLRGALEMADGHGGVALARAKRGDIHDDGDDDDGGLLLSPPPQSDDDNTTTTVL